MRRFTVSTTICPLLLILVSRPAASAERAGKTTKPLLVITGPNSNVRKPEYHRIASAKQLQKVWLQHHGKTAQQAFEERLTGLNVDFDRCIVVAIFQGAGTNSRGVTVDSVTETEKTVTVRFDESHYQTSGGFDRSSAFAFVVLPKSKKAVVLEENVQGLKGRPAKWKERARLK
jgi:hypothetical protein